jgi:hypothetical protein
MYKIKKYSYNQAKKLNVIISPSKNKLKKIDVFDNRGVLLYSIGDIKYNDYPTYLEVDKALAKTRRKLYKIRHQADRKIKGSAGFFADKILW